MATWSPKTDKEVQHALAQYVKTHDLVFPNEVEYEVIIDGLRIIINDEIVLEMALKPVDNYAIDETEHTHKYIRHRQLLDAI